MRKTFWLCAAAQVRAGLKTCSRPVRSLVGAALLAAAMAAAPSAVQAQYAPSFLAPKSPPKGMLLESANALGMVRGANSNIFDPLNRAQFVASGEGFEPRRNGAWPRYEIKRQVVGLSYHLSAARVDLTRSGPGGREIRVVQAVSGAKAWDETSPGVGAAATAAGAKDRAREIWLTPHGFIAQAMRLGPDGVTAGTRDGKQTLTLVLDGETITAVLGADKRPELIETQINHPVLGPTRLTLEYSGYKDFDNYYVFFPSRIVRKLGGRVASDLTVSDYRSNPYILFTPPAETRRASAN